MRYIISVFLVVIFFTNSLADKKRPRIIGQKPLTTTEGKSITIKLTDLIVVEDRGRGNDDDDRYPEGYRLIVYNGDNYSVSGNTVTPRTGFTGNLSVPVRVENDDDESKKYHVQIRVLPAINPNQRPVITGQSGISVVQDKSLTIQFSHLVVKDDDNDYPDDFTMSISTGSNYSVAGRTITPSPGFTGVLSIPVVVSDGTSSSEPFAMKVQVVAAGSLEIVGQRPIVINEDESVSLKLTDLTVNDPAGRFPTGFSLQVHPGENFNANGLTIVPARDFTGNLSIPITVTGNGRTSNMFQLLVVVNPVNDPPVIREAEVSSLMFSDGSVITVLPNAEVSDPDDEQLLYAEMFFDSASFQPGGDQLIFPGHESIRGIYDSQNGILSLIGNASLEDYQNAIRSVTYTFVMSDTLSPVNEKTVVVVLNDGESLSEEYSKVISMSDQNLMLDIPTAFTPNNDSANDTWKVRPTKSFTYSNASIKVYNHLGKLMYEANNFSKEWDGTLNGQSLPANAYFYTIDVDLNHRKVTYKGVVSLLR